MIQTEPTPNTITLYLTDFNIYIIVVYCPPHPPDALINFIQVICTEKELVLIGDFNLPSISWTNNPLGLHSTASDALFLDLFNTLSLHQWGSRANSLR